MILLDFALFVCLASYLVRLILSILTIGGRLNVYYVTYGICGYLVLAFVCGCIKRKIQIYGDFDSLPGPKTWPILGYLRDVALNRAESLTSLIELDKQYDGIWKLWLDPMHPNLYLSDPKHVKAVLTSQKHIEKSNAYGIWSTWVGFGLLTRDGDYLYEQHRRLLAPVYDTSILEKFVEIFPSLGNILLEKLHQISPNSNVDVYPYILRYILDVICGSCIGVEIDIQTNTDHDYLEQLNTFDNFCASTRFMFAGRSGIFFRYIKSKVWFKSLYSIKTFVDRIIPLIYLENRVQSNAPDDGADATPPKQSFLDILLVMYDQLHLSMNEISDEVNTFMLTSLGTMSSAISFALFELARNQDVQENVLEEIMKILGTDTDEIYDIGSVSELKYLDRVCREVLRLYPGMPIIERKVSEDLYLDDKLIPDGTTITMFLYGIHRSSKYYTDPEKFDPDRFLPENVANRDPFTYLPFSAGFRNCLGQRFLFLAMKATIARIIKEFQVLPADPEHKFEMVAYPFLKSLNGVQIKLKSRN